MNNMVKTLTKENDYRDFISAYLEQEGLSDPFVKDETELFQELKQAVSRDNETVLGVFINGKLNGVFSFLVLPDETYMETLLILSSDPQAYDELFGHLKENYKDYSCDFVFNPLNGILKQKLEEEDAAFDTEQQKMVYTHKPVNLDTADILLLTPEYAKDYINMHSKDLYWTGDKVIEAKDRFRTYIALDGKDLAGYIDVSYGKDENEPFDFLVKDMYRRRGYGRKLLAKALAENEPNGMILTVDIDNEPAIRLYKSLGFVKEENRNVQTVHWKIS